MKFRIGDKTDAALCVALKHEFLRCEDSFDDFASSATLMVAHGENLRIAYRTYNAYARFIHHLYEFLMGAAKRDYHDTAQLKWQSAERYVSGHAQRLLTNRRAGILNGSAPAWENSISHYPERVPSTFGESFDSSGTSRADTLLTSGRISACPAPTIKTTSTCASCISMREVGGGAKRTSFPISTKLPRSRYS